MGRSEREGSEFEDLEVLQSHSGQTTVLPQASLFASPSVTTLSHSTA